MEYWEGVSGSAYLNAGSWEMGRGGLKGEEEGEEEEERGRAPRRGSRRALPEEKRKKTSRPRNMEDLQFDLQYSDRKLTRAGRDNFCKLLLNLGH